MILGFKEQFKPLILSNSKIHTIREDKNDRWKPGNIIHFATGVRTKNYNQFAKGTCKSIQLIELINHGNHVFCKIIINDSDYIHNDCIDYENNRHDIHLLAKVAHNDGLNIHDFISWFVPNKNDKFKGKIIHWTDFQYT